MTTDNQPLSAAETIELEAFRRVLQDLPAPEPDTILILQAATECVKTGKLKSPDAVRGLIQSLIYRVKFYADTAAKAERSVQQMHEKWQAALSQPRIPTATNGDPFLCPQHLRDSLERYVTDRVPTGGFLRCCLENDFTQAALMATHDNVFMLHHIASFIRNRLPASCWGSAKAVDDWLAGKGHGVLEPIEGF